MPQSTFTLALMLLATVLTPQQSDAVKFAEGQAALEKYRDCQAAINAFESMSPQGKQSSSWTYYVGKAYECAGDYKQALRMYERYDVLVPGQAEILSKIGELRYLAGRERIANERAAKERAAKEVRDRLEMVYAEIDRRGRKLDNLERYSDALRYYQAQVENPNAAGRFESDIQSLQHHVNTANAIVAAKGRARGGFEEARYHLGMYMEVITATSAEITSRLRQERTDIPDLESKGLDGSGALRQLNDSSLCYNFRLRALSLHALGRTEQALTDMRAALDRCKRTNSKWESPIASFFMAAILYDLGRLQEALPHIDEALSHDLNWGRYKKLKDDIKALLPVQSR